MIAARALIARGGVAAAGLAACVATPALATGALSNADEVRSSLRRVVDCAVDNNTFFSKGDGVVQVLVSQPEGKPFQNLYLNIQNCVGQVSHSGRRIEHIRFAPSLLRGQIYRSIVLRGWGAKRRPEFRDAFARIANAKNAETDPLAAFGACVVRLDRANTYKAISSPTGGAEEVAAYQALAPTFADCVAPGQQIKFSKQVLEGAMAEGLFVDMFSTSSDIAMKKPN